MDNTNDNTERLVRYLDSELNADEAAALLNELNNNPALQQEMDNLILTKEVIKTYGLTQKVNGLHREMMQEMRPAAKNVVRSMPRFIMRIAASIIVLVGLFGLYQYISVSPGNLYNDQYTAYQVPKMRGAGAANTFEDAYSKSKYDEVIALYKQTAAPTINEQFFTAQAYMNKGDYNNAVSLFDSIIQKNKVAGTGTLNDAAEYYLALSYLKNNETAKALPLFNKIHDDKDNIYHDKISSWYLFKLKLLNWKN